MGIFRFAMLLALVVWIGGIIFFAFVVAPALFTILPTPQLAGDVVNRVLTVLHWTGLFCGVVFLFCSVTLYWHRTANLKVFAGAHILIFVMLALTAISQFLITPAMRPSRIAAFRVTAAASPGQAPHVERFGDAQSQERAKLRFQRLHTWSERLEGGVLFLGLGVVVLTARRFENRN